MQSEDRTNLCIWDDTYRLCRYVSFTYYVDLLPPEGGGGELPSVFWC